MSRYTMAYSDYGYSSPTRSTQSYGGNRVHRSTSMEAYHVRVYCGQFNSLSEFIIIDALRNTQSDEIVKQSVQKLQLGRISNFELAEAFCSGGQICKEKRLEPNENPVRIQLLWPKVLHHDSHRTEHKFFLRKKEADKKPGIWEDVNDSSSVDTFLSAFLQQPEKEYPDLCNLPNLNETTLLDNMKHRFKNGNIYTYIGSILIAVNPFKFYSIYNPKYVRMYQNKKLGELPPHIFAIADSAYNKMLEDKSNQCIVISGESGSGKTESTNLLLNHLSALSQKGAFGEGIEQTILGAGPVLEAFGNAKTVHNNNSSRFGKFIQVNYRENGIVHGAVVEKYLLEKSRLVHQAYNERNYHVFYYLLVGCTEAEKSRMGLTNPEDFHYLRQSDCYTIEDTDGEVIDEIQEFERLKQSMELVGFSKDMQSRIFCVLASVLHLGNIEFNKKRHVGHHEAVQIQNLDKVKFISNLLKVKEATLVDALIKKKTQAGGETVVMSYGMNAAMATRDAMAKCLYGALFDWIVLQVNQALISKKDLAEHKGNSIGVLDIFGFEDFGNNSFEQFCINYANEHLQYYFNQHIFKYEQEEYVKEGIQWKNIEFIDNTGCLDLFGKRLTGLLCLLDEECNFPGATNDTLLSKFISLHKNNEYFEVPQMREDAFYIVHYAGRVKYKIMDFREKNSDLMRHDVMLVLKNSSLSFVRELVGYDPVAILRWSIVRAFFRSYFAFIDAGRRHRNRGAAEKSGSNTRKPSQPNRAQHLAMTGNVSDSVRSRKNMLIIEKGASTEEYSENEEYEDHDYENLFPGRFERQGNGSVQDILNGSNYNAEDYKVMRRASRVLQKNKSFKPKTRTIKQLRDLQRMKTLTGKTQLGPRTSKGKTTKPPSVGAQFNYSLSKLMETLNQSNPFFIRCIKSNADKTPLCFDESVVLRQLRYTGMLATVRIRQSGYNYRVTFQDFIQMYRILLPKGLVSSREDIEKFLLTLDLNSGNYQIGQTKVFLREAEKMLLDNALHQAIMKHIINLQRWLKCRLDRKRFIKIKTATVVLQSHIRSFLAQRKLQHLKLKLYAAIMIQQFYRRFKTQQLEKEIFRRQCEAALVIQKHERMRQAKVRLKRLEYEQEEIDTLRSIKEENEKPEEEEQPFENHYNYKPRDSGFSSIHQEKEEVEMYDHKESEMKNTYLDNHIEKISKNEDTDYITDRQNGNNENNVDMTAKHSSSYVETHFGEDDHEVFPTELDESIDSDKVANMSTESESLSEETQDKLMESSDVELVIPKIGRDRGNSKESFESEFDLSFSESNFPKINEIESADSKKLPHVDEVLKSMDNSSDMTIKSSHESKKTEVIDEWGQLEVEFKHENEAEKNVHSRGKDLNYQTETDQCDISLDKGDSLSFHDQRDKKSIERGDNFVSINKLAAQQVVSDRSVVGESFKLDAGDDMMAEIDAEMRRREITQDVNDAHSPALPQPQRIVSNSEREVKDNIFKLDDEYVVGKDKASVSEEVVVGADEIDKSLQHEREPHFGKYIVGKDKSEIEGDLSFSPPINQERSSRYVVEDEVFNTDNIILEETVGENVTKEISSPEKHPKIIDQADKIDGSPIISKYKQRKKEHAKDKYVRKENKDIYIVERTEIGNESTISVLDDNTTSIEHVQSPVQLANTVHTDNQAKYAEIIQIQNGANVIKTTKDDVLSIPNSSQSVSKDNSTADGNIPTGDKSLASLPTVSSHIINKSLPKDEQNTYTSKKSSDNRMLRQKNSIHAASASDISYSSQRHRGLDTVSSRTLSGSDIVGIVDTNKGQKDESSSQSEGNLARDLAGRKARKQTRLQNKAYSDEILRSQEVGKGALSEIPRDDSPFRIQETSLKTDRTAKEKQEQPPRLRIISKASTPSARSSTELVLPFTEKDRRHSDIYKASEDSSVNMGMIPGETFDDFDGSAGVKHRRKFSETRNKPRAKSIHSSSTPHLRGQEGPKDVEIRIKPAKMMKSVSDDHLLYVPTPNCAKINNKKVSAPLATQESLEAPIEEDPGVHVHRIKVDNSTNRISFVMPENDSRVLPSHESQENLDPQQNVLNRAKKHIRNLVSGESTPRIMALGSPKERARTLPRSGSRDSGFGASPPHLDISPQSKRRQSPVTLLVTPPPSLQSSPKSQLSKTLSTDSGRSVFNRSDTKRSAIPRGSLKGDRSIGERSFEYHTLGSSNSSATSTRRISGHGNVAGAIQDIVDTNYNVKKDRSFDSLLQMEKHWGKDMDPWDKQENKASSVQTIDLAVAESSSVSSKKKISQSTGIIEYSKASIKQLLGQQSKNRKKSYGFDDSAEDSDDQFDSAKSPTPRSKDVKEAWTETKQASIKHKNRRKGTKKRRASKNDREGNTWNVAGTSKLQYPTKVMVKGPMELQQLDQFMAYKVREYSKGVGQKPSVFDKVFMSALKDFHNNLITSLSVSLQESRVEYKYNNLMSTFEDALRSHAKSLGLTEEAGDINMGINAFRGFLDEFQRKKVTKELPEPPKIKKEKKKKDKDKDLIEINGHKYSPVQFSIHTVCEKCNSHVWMVEKGYVCQVCHYTVHKKCSKESIVRCKGFVEPKSSHKGKVFSVPLSSLVESGRKVPLFIEKLISAIELNGLYTTGIYRKAGGAGKVKQLVKDLNTDVNSVDFTEEPLHALASLMKLFLRDLPEPLLTYDLYDDFIHGSEITEEREKIQAMYSLLERLPQPNYHLFERLVFHLAKIAQHESSNRMNPSALAIVFAPTVLRSGKNLPAQESLCHVPKISRCIQCVIEEQLRKILHSLADIQTLDNATVTAEERLSTIRASNRQKSQKLTTVESGGATAAEPLEASMPEEDEEEAMILQEQIQSLQNEKDTLTVQISTLDWRASSSEEDLLSTDEFGSTGDEIDVFLDKDSAFESLESVAASKSSLESQSNQTKLKPQQQTGQKKPRNRNRRKGSGSNPLYNTDTSNPNKRTTPQLKLIGEEEFC